MEKKHRIRNHKEKKHTKQNMSACRETQVKPFPYVCGRANETPGFSAEMKTEMKFRFVNSRRRDARRLTQQILSACDE